jgi:hypothetical protein
MSYIDPIPPLFQPDDDDKRTIAERFAEFDRQHPEVYELFRKFAYELSYAGRDRGSADQIVQRIRWETNVRADRPDHELKINDHFTALYARKLAAEDGRFKTFFEFRVRRTA